MNICYRDNISTALFLAYIKFRTLLYRRYNLLFYLWWIYRFFLWYRREKRTFLHGLMYLRIMYGLPPVFSVGKLIVRRKQIWITLHATGATTRHLKVVYIKRWPLVFVVFRNRTLFSKYWPVWHKITLNTSMWRPLVSSHVKSLW